MAGPSGQDMDDAMVIDDDDDFFATAERLSQEEEEDQPTQGLLGLDGPVTHLKIELERFLHMPKLPNSKVVILDWWKEHQQTLPLLAAAARKYLCITASAERLFSASGKVIITPLRSFFWDLFLGLPLPLLYHFSLSSLSIFLAFLRSLGI